MIISPELPSLQDSEDKSSSFKNCIRNNYRHLKKWAKRTSTNCFRIYDRHIPNYPLAIDFYAGRFSIQYFPRSYEEDIPPQDLVHEVESTLYSLFHIGPELLYWRSRIIRKKREQYEKVNKLEEFFEVIEHGVRFWINLTDYLDTGLFLDHRKTRQRVASLSLGKRVLNLFSYTCSFSLHAALSGAVSTTSVDMSNTYIDWGRRNFLLNDLSLDTHAFIREDCFRFLREDIQKGSQYDIIIVDPPTLSRSKKMEFMFDIQQDYYMLLDLGLSLLAPNGSLFFSTNLRTFVFDRELFPGRIIEEITDKTLPEDFLSKKIHKCWVIS